MKPLRSKRMERTLVGEIQPVSGRTRSLQGASLRRAVIRSLRVHFSPIASEAVGVSRWPGSGWPASLWRGCLALGVQCGRLYRDEIGARL